MKTPWHKPIMGVSPALGHGLCSYTNFFFFIVNACDCFNDTALHCTTITSVFDLLESLATLFHNKFFSLLTLAIASMILHCIALALIRFLTYWRVLLHFFNLQILKTQNTNDRYLFLTTHNWISFTHSSHFSFLFTA